MIQEHQKIIEQRPLNQSVNHRHTETAYKSISAAMSSLVRGEQIMSTSEWAARYRIMGSDNPVYDRWQPDLHPYLDEIGNSLCSTDPSEKVVVVGKATQAGMTECAINEVLRRIHQQPCPIIFVMDTKDKMAEFMRSRIDYAFAQNPFRGLMDPIRTSRYFPGGELHTYGAMSSTGLSSHPAFLVVGDEAAEYPHDIDKSGDFLTLARGRITAAEEKGKIAVFSKFKGKDPVAGSFYGYWVAGDCREYLCPCPECGEFWLWDIDSLKKDDDGYFMECPKCQGKTREGDQRVEMVAKGKWEASKIPDVSDMISYRVTGFISTPGRRPWKSAYEQYRLARRGDVGDLRAFYNDWLGLPYEEGEVREVAPSECKTKLTSLGYTQGEVPDDVILLTLGIDVQGGYLEWEVKGWSETGTCYSIDRGRINRNINDVKGCVGDIKKIMMKKYDGMHVWAGCIDSGGQFKGEGFASHVYQICSQFPDIPSAISGRLGALIPTKGQNTRRPRNIVAYRPGSKTSSGGRRTGPAWGINVNLLKMELYRTLMGDYDRNADGSLPFGLIFAPKDYPEEYFHEIRSEKMQKTIKEGRVSYIFIDPGSGRANEALDLHVMNRFAYEILEMPYAEPVRMKGIVASSNRARKKQKFTGSRKPVDKEVKQEDNDVHNERKDRIRKQREERARWRASRR